MVVALSAALLLLLCCAGPALSSVDCSNETAQGTWLRDNTPSSCGIALFAISNRAYTPANVAHIKTICDDENCGQKFVDWLVSEECRDQPIAVQTALEFSRTLCASFNGSVDGTCVFSEAMGRVDQTAIAAILQNCLTWWTGTAQGMCPSGTCSSAIQTAVDRIKCCYNNFFSTETAVDITTNMFRDITGTKVMAVNLTEPALLSACSVPNPGICNSKLIDITPSTTALGAAPTPGAGTTPNPSTTPSTTGASLTTVASMAVSAAGILVVVALQ